jgi:hypothetical protein
MGSLSLLVSFVKAGGGLEGCTWPSCIERDRGRQRAVSRAKSRGGSRANMEQGNKSHRETRRRQGKRGPG